MARTKQEIGASLATDISRALDQAYERADGVFQSGKEDWNLNERYRASLVTLSAECDSASTGFTNIITGLAIKAARPDIDVRYHQVQIQTPPHFNHRGVSETIIFPWLKAKHFSGAKSGWQTRTFERPRPYDFEFEENIARIKEPFLTCYDEVSVQGSDAAEGLSFMVYIQIRLREKKILPLATPNIDDINKIMTYLEQHFCSNYKSKGASRLPVLALHAVYGVMINELQRFGGKTLRPLQHHSAADAQTGAVGDIEVEDENGAVFEAVEVKHGIPLSEALVSDAYGKIMEHQLDRYYILTTHDNCTPDEELQTTIDLIKERIGCQIIANGVLPTLRYSLRLVEDPAAIFSNYAEGLRNDQAIAHEHREAWNDIIASA